MLQLPQFGDGFIAITGACLGLGKRGESDVAAVEMVGVAAAAAWSLGYHYTRGVKAIIAKSFERIHRRNLVGMGIIPLCFKSGEDADTLGLSGRERYTIDLPSKIIDIRPGQDVTVTTDNGKPFTCTVRFDPEVELAYFNNGGLLPCDIRNLIKL
ncbi:hypothetical protein F3Y22_tig00002237pilonHSYRG00094 [Hibiscus syriacus]|uniref:Aconitase A/isopropylmalate dehydratase small subunit swivel domain-containing protein n=1 Tax=Hibiscus syriacus TaxID=106335 RepID=A0A6A3CRM3_HIBSY|nr:hypothetical protein F3Y22_tig00002237pilonHSYRG00094 [Hibiscus syriacus]